MRFAVAALLLASATAHAAPATLGALLDDLAAHRCTAVSQLAGMLGPIGYQPKADDMANLDPLALPVGPLGKLGVKSVSARLVFDIYHQQPSKVADPPVGELVLVLDGKVEKQLEALLDKRPKGHHVAIGKDTVWRAGDLYYRRSTHELAAVCGEPPAWAVVPWTDRDIATATDQVIALLDGKPLPADDDRARFGEQGKERYVSFRPPLPAAAVFAALNMPRGILRSRDVHMSHWELTNPDGAAPQYKQQHLAIQVDEEGLDKLTKPRPVLDTKQLRITHLAAQPM